MRSLLVALLAAAFLLAPAHASAQPEPDRIPTDGEAGGKPIATPAGEAAASGDVAPGAPAVPISLPRRILATAGAVMPGLLLHGTGHYLAGDRRGAKKLIIVQGLSMAVAGLGGAAVGATGASRRMSLPFIPLLVGSAGTFLLSWGADIYGAAGSACVTGEPRHELPAMELEIGYLRVEDPQFAFDHLMDMRATVRTGPLSGLAQVQLAADDDNQRVRLAAEYRFFGPMHGRPDTRGHFLDIQAGIGWHGYGSDGFAVLAADVAVHGRYDLSSFLPSLRGSFIEMGAGLGLEGIRYDGVDGENAVWDIWDLLLIRFAYGMYIGRPGGMVHGEARLYYDHRRDDFATSVALPGAGNGFLGSVGADALLYGRGRFGVALRLQAGSAYLAGAGLLVRMP